jgi:superfamily I DNA/RNA helicase
VEGRDIGEGLVSLAKRWKSVTTTHQLKAKLEDYKLKEMQKYMAKGKEDLAQAIEDKVGALEAVISRVNGLGLYDIDSVVSSIRSLFGDSKAGEVPKVVTLSTVHKSKGREWNTVYILDRANLMPSKYARKEWQLKQEENLEYVAITRSKNELIDLVMPRKEARG